MAHWHHALPLFHLPPPTPTHCTNRPTILNTPLNLTMKMVMSEKNMTLRKRLASGKELVLSWMKVVDTRKAVKAIWEGWGGRSGEEEERGSHS